MKQSLKTNSYIKAFCFSLKRGGLFICIQRQVRFHNRTQALSTQHRMLNPHVTPPVSPPMNITHCVECIGCGRLGAGQVIQRQARRPATLHNGPIHSLQHSPNLGKCSTTLFLTGTLLRLIKYMLKYIRVYTDNCQVVPGINAFAILSYYQYTFFCNTSVVSMRFTEKSVKIAAL